MNLVIKTSDIKKRMELTTINTTFEATKEVKTSVFYEITLTHIQTNISVCCSGYSEIEVMQNCLRKLNDYIVTYEFSKCIPQDNVDVYVNEVNKVISDGKK